MKRYKSNYSDNDLEVSEGYLTYDWRNIRYDTQNNVRETRKKCVNLKDNTHLPTANNAIL